MGKTTLFRSDRVMVGLNTFEPGQEHAMHSHHGMDRVYHVVEGRGAFLFEGCSVSRLNARSTAPMVTFLTPLAVGSQSGAPPHRPVRVKSQ